MVMEIPLTQGYIALVDDEDYEQVMQHKWHASVENCTVYAIRNTPLVDGARTKIRLHTALTGWPLVDHRDGNGLNNTRTNLRPATFSENMRNARPRRDNRSGYKGVSRYRDTGRWQVHIRVNGKKYHLGLYDDLQEAAVAYDAAAREHFGEFAWLNFPERIAS